MLIIFLLAAAIPSKNQKALRKIKIIATVFPLMEFCKAVSGERGDVSLLIPPGAEVHTWQPRPSDIVRLSSADLFVYTGLNMEPWVDDVLNSLKNPALKVLEAGQGIPIMESEAHTHDHGHKQGPRDPHIWLDFVFDQRIVERIAETLSEIEPGSSLFFEQNAKSYKRKLQDLDQKYREGLKDCAQRIFIVGGHAAFGYLARRYNLEQISLYGLSPDAHPTPKKFAEIVDLARKHKVEVIYFEIQVSDRLARTLAEEVGARTLVLNPGANLTREQLKSGVTFFDIMEKNLENLKNGLVCK